VVSSYLARPLPSFLSLSLTRITGPSTRCLITALVYLDRISAKEYPSSLTVHRYFPLPGFLAHDPLAPTCCLPRPALLHAFPPPPMPLHVLCNSLLIPLLTFLASSSSCHPPASLLLAAVMLAAKHTGDGNSSWSYDIYTRATGVPVGELKVRRLPVSLFPPLQSLLLVLSRPPFWFFAATFEFLSPAEGVMANK